MNDHDIQIRMFPILMEIQIWGLAQVPATEEVVLLTAQIKRQQSLLIDLSPARRLTHVTSNFLSPVSLDPSFLVNPTEERQSKIQAWKGKWYWSSIQISICKLCSLWLKIWSKIGHRLIKDCWLERMIVLDPPERMQPCYTPEIAFLFPNQTLFFVGVTKKKKVIYYTSTILNGRAKSGVGET